MLHFIACLGAKLYTTARLHHQIFWAEKQRIVYFLLVLYLQDELRKQRSNINKILEKKLCSESPQRIRYNFLYPVQGGTFSLATNLQNRQNKRICGTKERLDPPSRAERKLSWYLTETEERNDNEKSVVHQTIHWRKRERQALLWGRRRWKNCKTSYLGMNFTFS